MLDLRVAAVKAWALFSAVFEFDGRGRHGLGGPGWFVIVLVAYGDGWVVEAAVVVVQVDDGFWHAGWRWWLVGHEAGAGRRNSAGEVVARLGVVWECSGGCMDVFGVGGAEG